MEHQTIIAYGNDFTTNAAGFDWLLFHEIGHEWWGNLVTALDWRDFWLHEGFQSCMDALYVEHLKGEAAYHAHCANIRKGVGNRKAVAPRESRTTVQMYMQPPDYMKGDGDVNSKGGLILRTLRHVIGDAAFFTALRRMAYPDPAMEKLTDGRQCRFATTDDFRRIAEQASGMELGWFFEVYLRQPELPRLVSEPAAGGVRLRWEVPGGLPFPMPVEVAVGGETRRVNLKGGAVVVPLGSGQVPVVDPDGWILKAE